MEKERNTAHDTVPILAWGVELEIESYLWCGEEAPAAREQAPVEQENRPIENRHTNKEVPIAGEVMSPFKELVMTEEVTLVEELLDSLLEISFCHWQNGIPQEGTSWSDRLCQTC